nr:MAG TPA: hypothetical protein [Caudoviricetes sp.]DAO55124.1 MAG TPA: hypothetical protein [Caudoviricetes sp.]
MQCVAICCWQQKSQTGLIAATGKRRNNASRRPQGEPQKQNPAGRQLCGVSLFKPWKEFESR